LRFGGTTVRSAVNGPIRTDTGSTVPGLYARTRDRFRGGSRTASSLALRNAHAGGDGTPQPKQPTQDPPPVPAGCQRARDGIEPTIVHMWHLL
jgi:hypothetical protein